MYTQCTHTTFVASIQSAAECPCELPPLVAPSGKSTRRPDRSRERGRDTALPLGWHAGVPVYLSTLRPSAFETGESIASTSRLCVSAEAYIHRNVARCKHSLSVLPRCNVAAKHGYPIDLSNNVEQRAKYHPYFCLFIRNLLLSAIQQCVYIVSHRKQ